MQFVRKTFIPADNVLTDKAIFIIGEAKDGLTRYVAMLDLYHPSDRWVEEMTVTRVSPGVEGSKPTFQGTFRHIVDEQEWRAAVSCFTSAGVFDEYNYSEMEKNVVDQKLRAKLAPYSEWIWDKKDGHEKIPVGIAQQIEHFKQKYLSELYLDEQKAKENIDG